MDPQNSTDNPQPPIQPQPMVPQPQLDNPVPQSPVQPVVQPVVQQAQPLPAQPLQPQTQPSSTVAQYAQPKKSKKGLVIGILTGVGVLLLGFGLLLVLAWPRLQSAALAGSFMSHMLAGDVSQAVLQTGDSASKDFLTTTAGKLKGENASLKESKYNGGTKENYYLFALTGGAYTSARVTTQKSNGKLVVASLVFDKQTLKLVPSGSTSTDTSAAVTNPETTSTKPAATATAECFDANSFSDLSSYPMDAYPDGRYVWTDNFFFKPDSTEYSYPEIMPDTFAKYKAFYKSNSSKQFTVEVSGMVFSATPATALANARAEKAKADLVSQAGIAADYIVITEPKNYENQDNAASRNVDIKIQSPESCITNKI